MSAIMILPFVVLFIVLLISGFVALVVHPRTRLAALGLAAALGVVIPVVLAGMVLLWRRPSPTVVDRPLPIARASDAAPASSPIKLEADVPALPGKEEALAEAPTLPAWANQPGKMVDGVYEIAIVSDPFTTQEEGEAQLEATLVDVAREYLERTGETLAAKPPVDAAYLRDKVVRDEFVEVKETSVGPMRQVHLLLKFDDEVSRELKDRLQAQRVERRLFQAGGVAAVVLGMLAALWGVLKIGAKA